MTKVNKITYMIAAVFAVLIFIFSFVGGGVSNAAASTYSPVLEDLCKDGKFNIVDYPNISDNYSLNVIQIAESTNGELLIYVYQPLGKSNLRASSINIAREPDNDENLKFKNYSLEYLNSSGVFFKYKVLDFKLSTTAIRFYNISNILRPFNIVMDDKPADGQTVSEVPNKVGQLWTVETVGNSVTYKMDTTEVITITQKVVGYCIYDDGLTLKWGTMEGITKAYFVAFDTDRPIDKLISADLTFWATRIQCKICCNDKHDHGYLYDFHDPEYIDFGTGVYNNEPLTISYTQKFSNQGGGNVRPANKYTWNRIRTTEEFIADNNNEDFELVDGDSLNGTKWVLNFYEAQDRCKVDNVWLSFIPLVTKIKGVADGEAELNNVYDVQILRLEFETEGKTYNLGVVDNVQTGSDKPINVIKDNGKGFFDWLADKLNLPVWVVKAIFWGIIAVIICAVFMPILALIFPVFGSVLLMILKGLLWFICLPFKGIAAIIKKIRGD